MTLNDKLKGRNIFLGSKSPRRNQLLSDLGLEFEILGFDVEEDFPDKLKREAIPLYLSSLK